MNNNNVFINEPRILRTEKDLHKERKMYANCPMEESIPCENKLVTKISLYPKDIIQHDTSNELFRNIHTPNLLNTAFFSKRNRDNVHNAIRRHVYEISQEKYLIARQSDEALAIIMRYTYKEYSLNSMNNVKEQIKNLNERVIKESVSKILPSIRFYKYYLSDKFSERTLFDIPTNPSTYGTKGAPFFNRF